MNFFSKNFQEPFSRLAILEAKADAKVNQIFRTTKFFGNFFSKKFLSKNLYCSQEESYLSIADAKVALIF